MQGEPKREIMKNIWEICLEFIPQTNLIQRIKEFYSVH